VSAFAFELLGLNISETTGDGGLFTIGSRRKVGGQNRLVTSLTTSREVKELTSDNYRRPRNGYCYVGHVKISD